MDAGLAENCSEGSFFEIATVVWEGHFASAGDMAPHLMAAGALAVEGESERSQAASDLSVFEA